MDDRKQEARPLNSGQKLKAICEAQIICRTCPIRSLCDALIDLRKCSEARPSQWSTLTATQIGKALDTVLDWNK